MSHRRRFLNLLMSNELASLYYLCRLDLHSCHNNLFYPTPVVAQEAAAANDPSAALFSGYDGKVVLKKRSYRLYGCRRRRRASGPCRCPSAVVGIAPPRCRRPRRCSSSRTRTTSPPAAAPAPTPSSTTPVAAAPPSCPASTPACISPYASLSPLTSAAADLKHDTLYVMEGLPSPDEKKKAQFLALVRGSKEGRLFHNDDDWRFHELPPPPYVADHGYQSAEVGCHALVGAAGDVICISTAGIGTYCFDTVSRKWSKAGDWALPFSGKIEHDRDLGIWVGFLDSNRNDEAYDPDRIEEPYRISASTDLFSATERGRLMELRDTRWWQLRTQDCK
ncbi:unnamed protein product [Urochloa humidicola]